MYEIHTLALRRKNGVSDQTDPGARVDSDFPAYQLFDKDLWEDFTFSERFPGFRELQKYFAYVEEKWDLRKDIEYHKNVESAHWDTSRKRWFIECSDGTEIYCKWLFCSVGFAAKQYAATSYP